MLNEIINYSDIPHNDFNFWLTESLEYNANIVFETDEYTEEYKQLLDIRDVDIKFTNDYADEYFTVAVWCRIKNEKEWCYLDNIAQNLYNRRFE
jgi:hypothetical protein